MSLRKKYFGAVLGVEFVSPFEIRDSPQPLGKLGVSGPGRSKRGDGGATRRAPRPMIGSVFVPRIWLSWSSESGADPPGGGTGLGKSDVGLVAVWFLFGSGGPFAIAGKTGARPPPIRDGSFDGTRLGCEPSETSLPAGERCSAEGVWNTRDWWYFTMLVTEGPSAELGGRVGHQAILEREGRGGEGVPLAGRGGARLFI